MKQVYNYQELAHLIEQGKTAAFTHPLSAQITAVQMSHKRDDITVTMALMVGGYVIGELESTYSRMESLLDAFDIDDRSEVWEVLTKEGGKQRAVS